MGDAQCGNVTRRDLSAFVASDASGKLNPVCFGKGLVGEMRCNDLPGRGIWCSRCPVPRGEERVPINVTDLNGNAGGTGSATGGSEAFQPSSTPDSRDGEPRRFLVTMIAVTVGALVGIAFLVVSIFVVRKRRRDAYSQMDGDRGWTPSFGVEGTEGTEGADTVRIQMSDVAGNGLHQNPMNRGDSPQRFQQQRSSQREKGNKRDNLPAKAKSQRVPPTPPVYTSRHLDLIDVRKRQSAKLDGWSEGVGGGAAASSSSVSSTAAAASSSSASTSSSSKRRVPPTPPTYSAKQLDLIRVRQEQKAKEAARRSEEEGAERVGDGDDLEEGWEEVTSEDGTYYWNTATNDTSWERPPRGAVYTCPY